MYLAIFMGAMMKFVHDESGVRKLSFFFFFLSLMSRTVLGHKSLSVAIIGALLTSVIVYFWGLLLIKYESSIFSWLIILVGGVFLINLI